MIDEDIVTAMPVISPGYVTLAEGTIASDYSLKNLSKSLGEAQVEFMPSIKAETNEYGGYKYTPLVAIIAAVRPSLVKHHLTVSQFPVTDLATKTITIYSRIVHWDSGEWMQNALELPGELALGKGGAPVFNQQTIGGSQTYAMKYAYKAIVGIPDAEEMIDSSGEKGDLPARSKGKPAPQTARRDAKPAGDAHEAEFTITGNRLTVPVIAVEKKHNDTRNVDYLVVWPDGIVDGHDRLTVWDDKLFDSLLGKAAKKTCGFEFKASADNKFWSITKVLHVGEDVIDGGVA